MRINLLCILIFSLFSTGCSSLRGSISTGAIIGGSLGAMSGMVFSPNKESRNGNALVFGALAAGAGALLANYLYTNDPENRDLKQMMIPDDPLKKKSEEVPLFDFSPELKNIKPELSFKPVKKYEVPIEKLPEELKGRSKSQHHESPAQLKFGHKRVKGMIDAHQRERRVIETVNHLRSQGMSLRAIAKTLNELKVPTKNKGKKWHPQMIKRILNI